jgi:hypothetical protein
MEQTVRPFEMEAHFLDGSTFYYYSKKYFITAIDLLT